MRGLFFYKQNILLCDAGVAVIIHDVSYDIKKKEGHTATMPSNPETVNHYINANIRYKEHTFYIVTNSTDVKPIFVRFLYYTTSIQPALYIAVFLSLITVPAQRPQIIGLSNSTF